MSLKPFKFQFLRSLSLSAGALLLVHSSAIALPVTGFVVSQTNSSDRRTNSSDRSVVVDTDENTGTSTQRTPTGSSSPITTATRFTCQPLNGEYTVAYQPESQPGRYFPWAKPAEMGGGWNSQKRCTEIARRLESYRGDGLQELTTSVENGYDTVCVITQKVSDCRIVFTVPPGQDPIVTRDRVFENLTVADSGRQTDAVNTYTSRGNGIGDLVNMGREILGRDKNPNAGSKSINLRPFLDKNDGGTGTQMQGGVKLNHSKSNQLNPSSFR